MRLYAIMSLICLGLIVACQPDKLHSTDEISLGAEQYQITFENPDDFETGQSPDQSGQLSIENGQYVIEQTSPRTRFYWGQGGDAIQNLAVEVVTQAEGTPTNNLYGVMCRVDDQGTGYAFLISNDGYGAIARSDAGIQSLSLDFLRPWQQHEAIKPTESNTVRGVCIDNYLALYVNDTLIVDVEDARYSEAGQVGMIAGIFLKPNAPAGTIRASFDDLTVFPAELTQ